MRMNMNDPPTEDWSESVETYLAIVETLPYGAITRSVWNTIRDEGLGKETGRTSLTQ